MGMSIGTGMSVGVGMDVDVDVDVNVDTDMSYRGGSVGQDEVEEGGDQRRMGG